MTLPVDDRRMTPYVTNGVITDFAFDFYVPTADSLLVVLVDASDNQFTQTYGSDYEIEGIGDETGGTVVFSTAPSSGFDVYLIGEAPLSQPTDFKNQSSYQGIRYERTFDRTVAQIQELDGRALVATNPITRNYDAQGRDIEDIGSAYVDSLYIGGQLVTPSSMAVSMPLPTGNALRLPRVNSGGTAYELGLPGAFNLPVFRDSVAAMSAIPAAELVNGMRCQTGGYYANGDGGHGTYCYDSGSTATVNGGTVINAAGGVGRWLLIVLTNYLSARQFGAKADGITNDTTAAQAFLNAAATNYTMDFCGGNYLLTSGSLSLSSVANLKIKGSGAKITEASPIGDTFTFTSCDKIEIYGFDCDGGETQAYWAANSPTTRRRFFSVVTSTRPRVHDITGTAKRCCVILDNCTRGIVYNVDHQGFLQNLSSGVVAGANDLPAIEFKGGRHNKAYACHGENLGSVVLTGFDGEGHSAWDITGKEIHDNLVYVSSGKRCRAWGSDGENVANSIVKTRGSMNIAICNTGRNTLASAFSQTGNGTSLDSVGANGQGSIMAFNTAELIGADGVTIGAQDGFYARDFVTAFNSFDQLTSTGGFAAIRGAQIQGGTYAFNQVNDTDTTIAYEISKPVGGSKTESVIFFANSAKNHNGASEMMSINDIQKSIVAFNYGDNANEFTVHARRCDSSIFASNLNVLTQRAVHFDTTEVCATNFVFGNYGTTGGASMGANGNAIGQNMQNGTSSGIGAAPAAVGLLTTVGAVGYMSVATGAAADWKQIT